MLAQPLAAAELDVFSTGAPSEAAKAIAAKFSAATGHRLAFTVGPPAAIKTKLDAGEHADVVIVPGPLVAALMKEGKLRPASAVEVARVGIGVVVREGAPRPDIATPAAIRQMLLDARSIAYPHPTSGGGFTGKEIERMIEQMGIADAVSPKAARTQAIAGGVALVAKGDAEVGLFNISEILPIKGVTLVGPLPPTLQHYIIFGAAIASGATAREPAEAFIRAMASPAAGDAWTSAGMEPVNHP